MGPFCVQSGVAWALKLQRLEIVWAHWSGAIWEPFVGAHVVGDLVGNVWVTLEPWSAVDKFLGTRRIHLVLGNYKFPPFPLHYRIYRRDEGATESVGDPVG